MYRHGRLQKWFDPLRTHCIKERLSYTIFYQAGHDLLGPEKGIAHKTPPGIDMQADDRGLSHWSNSINFDLATLSKPPYILVLFLFVSKNFKNCSKKLRCIWSRKIIKQFNFSQKVGHISNFWRLQRQELGHLSFWVTPPSGWSTPSN